MESWIEIAPVAEFRPEAPQEFGLPAEEADIAAAMEMGSARRRSEWLTWRGLVRRRLGPGTVLEYTAAGAPRIADKPLHLSVSHSGEYVAVICSEQPCAIDIERTDRRFGRVAARYLSPQEELLAHEGERELFRAVAWSAKESLYKYAAMPGADFLHDLRLESFDTARGVAEARAAERRVRVRFAVAEGFVLTWICAGEPSVSMSRADGAEAR